MQRTSKGFQHTLNVSTPGLIVHMLMPGVNRALEQKQIHGQCFSVHDRLISFSVGSAETHQLMGLY